MTFAFRTIPFVCRSPNFKYYVGNSALFVVTDNPLTKYFASDWDL